jgi:two-component system, NarL family, invasion response regulator UvrY
MRKTAAAVRSAAPRIAAKRPAEQPTRILIVDDHPIVIAGCRALLADDAVVITEAANAESGAASYTAERPDVCLIDINLPGVSGYKLAYHILGLDAGARIIMLSIHDDPIFAARAIETGAKGYVSKSGDPDDLIAAIREVKNGGVFLPPAIAKSLAFAGPVFAANRLARLSPREIEILRLIGHGKSLSEIALLVKVSYKTVANTSSLMRQKLGVHSARELVRLAIESRLV